MLYFNANMGATLTCLRKEVEKDPAFREEYAHADDEFALIEALVHARTAANKSGGKPYLVSRQCALRHRTAPLGVFKRLCPRDVHELAH